MPHAPQCSTSRLVFTQIPAQRVRPGGHAQAPALQTASPLQVIPQPPQFVGSAAVVQLPPQVISLPEQAGPHCPAEQT